MKRHPRFLIVAGEVSGDMRAAGLVTALRRIWPEAEFFGLGGPRMRAAGVDTREDIASLAVMGFAEVLRRLPYFRRVFRATIAAARAERPDAAILVDYPGFNLRLAARLHALTLPVIYYVCPQVWAWHRARIPRMARTVDLLLTLFPFEPGFFDGTGLRVRFVGHPLVDRAAEARAAPECALPWRGTPRIALLPGSRAQEIDRLLPVFWSAAGRLQARRPEASFLVAAAAPEAEAHIRARIATLTGGPAHWDVVADRTWPVLRQARAALVASGTATVETALMRCPMLVVYRTSRLTYALARRLVRVPHIGMVNLIAEDRICPEFIQAAARPEALADALAPLLEDGPERARMLAGLDRVVAALGPGGSDTRAAEEIAALLTAVRA
jgi:lipid-A-disaccharide synthase